MRKTISLLLVFAMLFAFASLYGCEKTPAETAAAPSEVPSAESAATVEPSTAQAETETPSPAPAEKMTEIQKMIANGETPVVGIVCPFGGAEIVQQMMKRFADAVEELGCKATIVDANMDMTYALQSIENFVTMKAALIWILIIDVNLIKDACLKAEAQGTHIVYLGTPPDYEISGCVYSDYKAIGTMVSDMAIQWADVVYGKDAPEGSIGVATFESYTNTDGANQSNAMRDTILADKRMYITYTENDLGTADAGYTWAQNAMTADANTRIFLCWECTPGIGVDTYINSIPEYNVSEFGIFGVSVNDAVLDLIEKSKTNESCYRGAVSYGETPGVQPAEVAVAILTESVELPYFIKEKLYPHTSFDYIAPEQ
ncbi:MAG: sugar ABC transporter substrate-binding protein [Oscillospiraceae bacterium]|jgi:ABC-type sugar transport system substrate-binding protein